MFGLGSIIGKITQTVTTVTKITSQITGLFGFNSPGLSKSSFGENKSPLVKHFESITHTHKTQNGSKACSMSVSEARTQGINIDGFEKLLQSVGLKMKSNLCLPPKNPLTGDKIDWKKTLDNDQLGQMNREMRQANNKDKLAAKGGNTDKMEKLLEMALKSGNFTLAMLLFAHVEAKDANELSGKLMQAMQKMRNEKKDLTEKIATNMEKSGGTEDEKKKTAADNERLKNSVQDISDNLTVLQTFLKDVAQNKQSALEMANGFMSEENQTTMSIARSVGK